MVLTREVDEAGITVIKLIAPNMIESGQFGERVISLQTDCNTPIVKKSKFLRTIIGKTGIT